jgi:hypothetical protein
LSVVLFPVTVNKWNIISNIPKVVESSNPSLILEEVTSNMSLVSSFLLHNHFLPPFQIGFAGPSFLLPQKRDDKQTILSLSMLYPSNNIHSR